MKEIVLAGIEAVTSADNASGPGFDSPRVLSEAARRRMAEIAALGADAVPFLVDHARFLYGDMLRLDEEEKNRRPAPPPKRSFLGRLLGRRPKPAPVPATVISSSTRRAQVKASIYALGLLCADEATRTPEALRLLTEFAQTRHFDVFDDAKAVLARFGITERNVWEAALKSLPLVAALPGETELGLDRVISMLGDAAGLHLVDRRACGDWFAFGSSCTHEHRFYRTSREGWVRRVLPA